MFSKTTILYYTILYSLLLLTTADYLLLLPRKPCTTLTGAAKPAELLKRLSAPLFLKRPAVRKIIVSDIII